MSTDCTIVPVVIKGAADRIPVQVDWHDWLINTREPGVAVAVDFVMRPTRSMATGFQYRCTVAGVTSCLPFFRLRWPHTVGGLIVDGSVSWTAEAIDDESLRTTVTDEIWTETPGVVLSAESAADSIYSVQVEGGVSGQEYVVRHSADFANGEKRSQAVQINIED